MTPQSFNQIVYHFYVFVACVVSPTQWQVILDCKHSDDLLFGLKSFRSCCTLDQVVYGALSPFATPLERR